MLFEFGARQELQLLLLLVTAAALLILAGPLRVPYPILLVLGGLVIGFAPGVPPSTMPPDVVLVGILPPLLYQSAFFTGLRELRQSIQSISLLAVGLVVATTAGVAVVAHQVVDLSGRRRSSSARSSRRPTRSPRPRSAAASACPGG